MSEQPILTKLVEAEQRLADVLQVLGRKNKLTDRQIFKKKRLMKYVKKKSRQ